jgi:hypothetical protein
MFPVRPLTVAIVCLVLYFLPFVFSGSDSNIIIHDNLDNNFVRYKILSDEGKIFGFDPDEEVNAMMSGLPRRYFTNGLNLLTFLLLVVSPFTAYLINFILVHSLAFAGMYLLLRNHFLHPGKSGIIAFVSLCFALLPLYTIYGFSVAGIPLLLYAFMNLSKGTTTRYDYWIIGLFPIHSSLMLIGIFFIGGLIGWAILNFQRGNPVNWPYLKGVCLLVLVYTLFNFHIFLQVFNGAGATSHRAEFVLEQIDFARVVEQSADFFTTLHYHVAPPLGFLLIPVVLAIILGVLREHRFTASLIYLTLGNMAIAFISVVYNWEMLEPLWAAVPITRQFQWNRFYFISPILWFIQLGLSLQVIKDCIPSPAIYKPLLYSLSLYILFFIWKANTELRETTANLFSSKKTGWSYRQFFDEQLFSQIKVYINKPVQTYRVASLGMHPSVSLYNGMQTIDGYLPTYPLTYKQEFKKIIAAELEKAPHLKQYFNEWGSRCYLFSSELSHTFEVEKEANITLRNLTYDFTDGPNVQYILSAAEIAAPEASGLKLLKVFETEESKWRIFLYAVLARENKATVTVTILAEQNDMLKIYFIPEGKTGFDEKYSVAKNISGQKDYQKVSFLLPDTVSLSGLRFDISTNPDQKFVKLKEITVGNASSVQPIVVTDLIANQFISTAPEGCFLQPVEGRFDPFFEFNQKSIEIYNTLRQNRVNTNR